MDPKNPASRDDPHAPLREDVRRLGEMLGDTLREHGGEQLYARIEHLRRLSVDARAGRVDESALRAELAMLDGDDLLHVARAFAQFLNLANIAEQHHRVRMRRAAAVACRWPPEAGTFTALSSALREARVSGERLAQAAGELAIDLVFTAHPTEVTRRTLMHKHAAIAARLGDLDRADLPPDERDDALEDLRRLVAACWHTDEVRQERPTPVEEAKWGFATLEQTLWQAVPRFVRDYRRWLATESGEPVASSVPVPVRFSGWMGGDRDGNPHVTHAVTREVLLLARWQAADLFLRDVEQLQGELSMHAAGNGLRAVVGDVHEPYRVLMRGLRDRLRNTRAWVEACLAGQEPPATDIIACNEDLRAPLSLAHESLVACGLSRIADGLLADTRCRAEVFGAFLWRLDIRQDAGRHAAAIAAVTRWLGLGDYREWPEPRRQSFLVAEIASRRPLVDDGFRSSEECDDAVREVLDTFGVIAATPRAAFGAYVISMAGAPSDVLAVCLLQKIAGVRQWLPVVPLFETLDDLDRAASTVDALLSLPAYRERIDDYQQVMVGYSDSAKDAGYLAASWAQYRAQEALVEACRHHGVRLELFHGRGGSVSRGGTPTRQALLSQPPASVAGRIRVTEQGEVIRFKFGLEGIARETLETCVASTLEAMLLPPPAPDPAWRERMDDLARAALAGYRATVREDPRFVPYFRAATPERELATLAIGSRPSKRREDGGIESLRAIPWVFAWTQVRLMLPAWLGTDVALAWLRANPQHRDTLAAMLARWPYFRALVDMQEMVLAKAEPRIAAYYESRLCDPSLAPLGESLRARLDATVRGLLDLLHRDSLLADNPVMQWSIAVRNPYTDPLHILQAELVRRHRDALERGDGPDAAVDLALKVTIAGIAAGMRNTG